MPKFAVTNSSTPNPFGTLPNFPPLGMHSLHLDSLHSFSLQLDLWRCSYWYWLMSFNTSVRHEIIKLIKKLFSKFLYTEIYLLHSKLNTTCINIETTKKKHLKNESVCSSLPSNFELDYIMVSKYKNL